MRFTLLLLLLLSFGTVQADEGLWLPSAIERGTIQAMQRRGFQLTASDVYSTTHVSLKDAIVRFGGGCTGEVISPQGLLLTNHHCGYGQIQAHSSVERDLLTNGFAAMNRAEELPNIGLKVSFLVEMREVTARVKGGEKPQTIADQATQGTHYEAKVEPLYNGGEYYLFVYETFRDIRLVFAPPSQIGKFGGDTDNWIWPRHTGDFAVFRIYANKENKPADYSPKNVPYTPKKHLTLSARGIQSGDFTMVYGFPGRTTQYLHSAAVRQIVEVSDPLKIALRQIRLDAMNAAADTSAKIRIQYAAQNAGVANAWKKWQGELQGLARLKTVERKVGEEAAFERWAQGGQYEGLTRALQKTYDSIAEVSTVRDLYNEGVWGSEAMKFWARSKKEQDSLRTDFDKNYHAPLDQEITAKLLSEVARQTPPTWLPVGFSATSRATPELAAAFKALETTRITPLYDRLNKTLDSLYTLYIEALRAMHPAKLFYPDANSTLRVAYGAVEGFEPMDGLSYKPTTTLRGVVEKSKLGAADYTIPARLAALAPQHPNQPVAFLASNHTSGGNSGSPVLDAQGRLIGLNFDRVWQGTMSDIEFDATVCRNISVDIRFVLWCIDTYAGAGYLLDEMTIVR